MITISLSETKASILRDLLVEWIRENNRGDMETLSKRKDYVEIYRKLGGTMKFEEFKRI